LPNVGPYIYDVSISGFTRSSIYIYDISSLRVNLPVFRRQSERHDLIPLHTLTKRRFFVPNSSTLSVSVYLMSGRHFTLRTAFFLKIGLGVTTFERFPLLLFQSVCRSVSCDTAIAVHRPFSVKCDTTNTRNFQKRKQSRNLYFFKILLSTVIILNVPSNWSYDTEKKIVFSLF